MKKSRILEFSYFAIIAAAIFLFKIPFIFAQPPLLKDARQLAMFDAMGKREITLALQKTETTIIKSEREGIISFVLSRLHPSASLTTEYNDNIFLLQANPKGDIINTLDAGFCLVWGGVKDFYFYGRK